MQFCIKLEDMIMLLFGCKLENVMLWLGSEIKHSLLLLLLLGLDLGNLTLLLLGC